MFGSLFANCSLMLFMNIVLFAGIQSPGKIMKAFIVTAMLLLSNCLVLKTMEEEELPCLFVCLFVFNLF